MPRKTVKKERFPAENSKLRYNVSEEKHFWFFGG